MLHKGISRHLVGSVYFFGVWIGEAVVLVEHDGADVGLETAGVQHAVERDGQVIERGDGVVRQAYAGLEEQSRRIERR